MKLKEIPLSIYYTLKLNCLNVKNLNEEKKTIPVIVSLTSIPSRLKYIHITVRSILNQSEKPKKIVLWLHENDGNKIPEKLKILIGPKFEIKFSKINCPHLKLVESLKEFPNQLIATCDDDFIYSENWLGSLYHTHLNHPNAIIAHRLRQIQYNSLGELLPYKQWNLTDVSHKKSYLAIGSEGVLYPPNSLDEVVIDDKLFLKLAPKADDLWFKAMSLIKNTEIIKCDKPPKFIIPVYGTQEVSLKKENVNNNRNLTQWEALTNYFKLNIRN
jgi:hypothetical protein